MKPLIGILTVTDNIAKAEKTGINTNYVAAVIKGGGAPLLIPITDDDELLNQYIQLCDGFLFSGGIDISPCFYDEQPSPLNGSTSMRLDRFQLGLARRVISCKKPYLAICRGIQLVNVACGGSLYQDIREYSPDVYKHKQETDQGDVSHLVAAEPGSILEKMFGTQFWTNSYHHQSVKTIGKGLKITARTLDGIVEGLEAVDYPYGVSVQWHPEVMLRCSDDMLPLFTGLIRACI